MANKLCTESFKPTFHYINDDEEETENSVRVMSICYSDDMTDATFALIIDQDGVVIEHQRLKNFTKRINSRNATEVQQKVFFSNKF